MPAAIQAARELGGPIIAMTVVLAAVYVPIGLQGGLTGALFSEFAFALIGAVTISGVGALTLSPMLCSRLLKLPDREHGGWEARLTGFIDRQFHRLRGGYERWLHGSLNTLPVTLVLAAVVLASNVFLFSSATTELSPTEDQGVLIVSSTGAPNSTLQQRQLYARQIYDIFAAHPETEHVFQIDAPGQFLAGMVFKPWDKRDKTTNQLQPVVQQEVGKVAGLRTAVFQPPPLPGAFGLPVQFVLVTTDPYERLNTVAQGFLQEAQKSGMFIFLDTDLKVDNPQTDITIDRDKTAQLGLRMSDVGSSLSALLGGAYVNYFSISGRSYKVIPQVQQRFRLNPQQLLDYYIRTSDGTLVPFSTIASISTKTVPESLNHFQQLNSATIQGVAMPGVAQGTALQYLQDLAARTLPKGYSVDYSGVSRQYIQESGGFIVTILFAVIMIFLVLAALFESFRDPVIILVSVPMSIAGALIFVALGVGSVLVLMLIVAALGLVALIFVAPRVAGVLVLMLATVALIFVALGHGGLLAPTSIVGGLISLAMGFGAMSLNIYTKVGLVTLIGLISKHGILIVQFANHLQAEQGLSKREAIERAAGIRLRPILMTTAAMVFGVVPLIIATGAGAVSRFQMGIVIASGLTIGTLFTLFVVPAVYLVIAADHHVAPPEMADEAPVVPHAAET
jgi:multidrug efflux pump